MKQLNLGRMYFSYNQFMVFDESVELPGCAWTEAHSAQGFARRESAVCFGSILPFGEAELAVSLGPYVRDPIHERVIAVPFRVVSGKIVVEGPEEYDVERIFSLPNGDYRLTAAQHRMTDELEKVELYFEMVQAPLPTSEVIVADSAITVTTSLIETALVAGDEE